MKNKLIRISTVPVSLKILLKGQLRYMSENEFDVYAVSSSSKELDELALDESVSVVPIDMTRTISPIKDIKSLWKFYKLCKKIRPKIVHSHTPKAGVVGMLGAKLAGVPIRLHTVAGLPLMEATGIRRLLLDFVEKFTYSCATKVYPNSNGLLDFILNHNFTSEQKLKVIGNGSSNGIDIDYFNPLLFSDDQKKELKKSLQILPDDFVFIYVGRLVGDKGINELVFAYSQLKAPNTKLLLVGQIEDKLDPLQPNTIKEMHQNPNIICVGFQMDVRPYFAISHCLVFPSYREGFPNVVMQAGAMRLPSIVTNINGCNEIIFEGQNGTLIPTKNWKELKNAMLKIIEDYDWRFFLQSNSRALIINRFKQEFVWKSLLFEYKNLLKSEKNKVFRTSTIPVSLDNLLQGQLHFLNQHFNVVAVSGNDKHLERIAVREKVTVKPITMQRNISLFADLISLWRLYLLLKKEKPTIIHSMTPKAGLLSMVAGKLARVPIRIHTFTGLIFPSKKGLLRKIIIAMDKILCICATNVYPEGQGVKNDLLQYKITKKPLQVLANGNINGVNTSYFDTDKVTFIEKQELRTCLKILETDFVFIFVGRLVGDKGINELVKAFSLLQNSNCKLLLVGPFESHLDPLYSNTLETIENNPRIINVGFQEDVRSYFAISHCLVFPSYREGFPNVVLQAGSMNLPSIVTDINGCNEIIEEGINGIIIPPKNIESLYLAMQKMLLDDVFRNQLKKNARRKIVVKYEQHIVWEALLKEYKRLLNEKEL